ncbi:MAG TPA: MBL fold metallo-hydrolase [Candidatus Marinimicrobia bacterium]|nr:MBL fold metallo-hydrolase [Candidatus Neomarinimicrobiota bacterium]HQH56848.1 MBL fold metallo-hydrolase [Candidatus Neomarinimicrobiota bacterium]HRS90435.1 MBL fold metallo-hydrolase [Candidatus Neomarinimicrobiota bacterium]HRU45618.1 MBL fold metallo-hydrolase [Candidatus Neomarinimicrobiota bacterium]
MRFLVLYDKSSLIPALRCGWGFACLVDGRVLFDTADEPEPLFENLEQMNVKLENIKAVVISHDHHDHTGGLWGLLEQRPGLKVYACPGFSNEFKKRVIALRGDLIESIGFREIDGRVSVTGEIPAQYKGAPKPEQALMARTANGIAVVTGCSHPGIVNILAKVQNIFPAEPIALILGGLHLRDTEVNTIDVIASQLIKMGVQKISPTHCTGERAEAIFQRRFGANYIPAGAGSQIEI